MPTTMRPLEYLQTDQQHQDFLHDLDEPGLIAQELVQRGAIHALQHLLMIGATEHNLRQMLDSCRENLDRIADEGQRRGLDIIRL